MATKKRTTKKSDPDEIKFEDAMAELEEIVSKLEAGDTPLEDSLEAFESGVKLVRTLHKRLDEVQARVEKLTANEDGAPEVIELSGSALDDE